MSKAEYLRKEKTPNHSNSQNTDIRRERWPSSLLYGTISHILTLPAFFPQQTATQNKNQWWVQSFFCRKQIQENLHQGLIYKPLSTKLRKSDCITIPNRFSNFTLIFNQFPKNRDELHMIRTSGILIISLGKGICSPPLPATERRKTRENLFKPGFRTVQRKYMTGNLVPTVPYDINILSDPLC